MAETQVQLTPQAWKKHSRETREEILALLARLDSGELKADACKEACQQLRVQLKQLRTQRDAMVFWIADEMNFLDEMETRLHEIEERNKRFHLLPPAPTNASIDYVEKHTRHFAQGKSFYKLFWVFFIGSFLGVLAERTWCWVRYGFYEPRVGAIYGPFNPVYGLGAWALTVTLFAFRNHNRIFSFVGGALVGSAVEYFCSWFQEMIFGSASWDYSMRPFNLNGRICLLYSIYWGVLGVLWIKELYPRMAKLILKIPNRVGKPLTFALAALLALDFMLTAATVVRWMERRQGVAPANAASAFLDEHYPDALMESRFTNLVFYDEPKDQRAPEDPRNGQEATAAQPGENGILP